MAKRIFAGSGILSGEIDDEELARERELEQQKEVAAAERLADQEETKHRLEAAMIPYLRAQVAAELQELKRPSTESNGDFKRFRAYCEKLDLPPLPAAPQTVAAFLVKEIEKGRQHLNGLIKTISETHQRCDLHDPTSDLLVRALLRLADDEPQPTDSPS